MSPIPGTWDLIVKTPIGSLAVVYFFAETAGVLSGTATSADETVPLAGLQADDAGRVSWRQSVTRPIRLTLDFEVSVTGETLAGHARAGKLPRSKVSGTRRPAG